MFISQKQTIPPGPSNGLLGLRFIKPFQNNVLTFLKEMSTYGDIAHFRLGPIPAYAINSPQLVYQIMVNEPEKYTKPDVNKQVIGKILGNGLLLSDGDFWRKQRRLMQPAFHHKRVEAYAKVMVDITGQFISTWKAGDVHDISKDMHRLTLSIVAKTLFDINDESLADRIDAVARMLQEQLTQRSRSLMYLLPLDWLPTRSNQEVYRGIQVLNSIIDEIIAQRRVEVEDRGDLLSMLMLAQDENGKTMTDQQVHDEAITLFLAGHETSALSLAWTWYLLSTHPQVQEKLYAEIDAVLQGRGPTLQDLPNLQYVDMIIKESLRLYPPAYLYGREVGEDTTLGEYEVKKGSFVIFTSFLMHRDPRYFDQPEQFIPERWSNNFEKSLPKCAYYPFGAGPHICIGNSFAAMQARLVLATVAQRFRMEMLPNQNIKPIPLLTLCMSENAHMRIHTN